MLHLYQQTVANGTTSFEIHIQRTIVNRRLTFPIAGEPSTRRSFPPC